MTEEVRPDREAFIHIKQQLEDLLAAMAGTPKRIAELRAALDKVTAQPQLHFAPNSPDDKNTGCQVVDPSKTGQPIDLASVLRRHVRAKSGEFVFIDGKADKETMAAKARYCHECGHVGEIPEGMRSCCPDGNHAAIVPLVVALQAQAGQCHFQWFPLETIPRDRRSVLVRSKHGDRIAEVSFCEDRPKSERWKQCGVDGFLSESYLNAVFSLWAHAPVPPLLENIR